MRSNLSFLINHGQQGNGGVRAMRQVPSGRDPIHNGVGFGVLDIANMHTFPNGPDPIRHRVELGCDGMRTPYINLRDVDTMRTVVSGLEPIQNRVGYIDRNDIDTLRLVPQGPNPIHNPDQNAK